MITGMSRRKRKLQRISRTPKNKRGVFKKIALWGFVSFIVLLLLVVVGGYFAISSYLSGESFRKNLEHQLASKAHVGSAALAPLEWGGSSLSTDSVALKGGELLRNLEISRLDASVDRTAIFEQHLKIRNISIDQVKIDLVKPEKEEPDFRPGFPAPPPPPPRVVAVQPPDTVETPKVKEKSWFARHLLPNKYTLEKAIIRNLSLNYTSEEDTYSIDHVRISVSPDTGNDEYKIDFEDGTIKLPFDIVSVGQLKSAKARGNAERLTVTECRISPNYGGFIDAEGEWEKTNSRWWANLVVRQVHCSNLMSPDWKKKVDGVIGGTARFRGEHGKLVEVSGTAQIDGGVLTALPVLDTLAAFTKTNQFRRLSFNAAEANYTYSNETWKISDIVLASDGLIRIEGWIEIREDDTISGRLQVGIVPGIFAHVPGAEEKVFLPSNNANKMGLLWTNVNISGTTDYPREDLTARLIAAAGDRLFEIVPETGKKVLLFSGDLATRLLGGMKQPDNGEDGKEEGEQAPPAPVSPILPGNILNGVDKAREAIEIFGL